MRVALFRARDDGERTAERLRALAHEPVLAPVIEIVATPRPLPPGPFAAVVFASAHAIEVLRPDDAGALRDVPAFCVGAWTAARAASAGLSPVGTAQDAVRLVQLIRSELGRPARLLLLAGRQRKPVIEDGLAAAGHEVAAVEVYEARAVAAWPESLIADLGRAPIEAALHYSRRSAELALRCALAARMDEWFRSTVHCCLSGDVAAALGDARIRQIVVAERPNEQSLLAALDSRRDSSVERGGTRDAARPQVQKG